MINSDQVKVIAKSCSLVISMLIANNISNYELNDSNNRFYLFSEVSSVTTRTIKKLLLD